MNKLSGAETASALSDPPLMISRSGVRQRGKKGDAGPVGWSFFFEEFGPV